MKAKGKQTKFHEHILYACTTLDTLHRLILLIFQKKKNLEKVGIVIFILDMTKQML